MSEGRQTSFMDLSEWQQWPFRWGFHRRFVAPDNAQERDSDANHSLIGLPFTKGRGRGPSHFRPPGDEDRGPKKIVVGRETTSCGAPLLLLLPAHDAQSTALALFRAGHSGPLIKTLQKNPRHGCLLDTLDILYGRTFKFFVVPRYGGMIERCLYSTLIRKDDD